MRDEFGVELPVRAVFGSPTVAQFARCIEEAARAGSGGSRSLDELTALPKTAPAVDSGSRAVDAGVGAGIAGRFGCPRVPSPVFGKRTCNLIMVVDERIELASFERLAAEVRNFDPPGYVAVIADAPGLEVSLPERPTLVFGSCTIRNLPPRRGRVCCGAPLSKSEEYDALGRVGIPVPPWVLLTENSHPDLSGLGEYLVQKPDHGARGAEVRIVRQSRVRWRPRLTAAAGPSDSTVLQRFIYTGPWPVSYRVNVLFGRVLYAVKLEAWKDRPALQGPTDFRSPVRQAGVSIVSNARDSGMELCFDERIIHLGERAHQAFPDIPLLGVDILREEPSGQLYVIEVNALGYNWNFTSRERREWQVDIETQFDGVRKAAYVLAEHTQLLAS